MVEKTPKKNASKTAEDARGEEAYVVRPELVREIIDALDASNIHRVEELVGALHHADLADLIEMLAPEDRKVLIEIIRAEFDPETLATLDEHVREEVVEQLGAAEVAAAISELDTDDAVEVVEHLDDSVQQEVLDAVPAEDRALLEEGLTYPEDSAGRLMQRELVAIPSYWTVGETIDFMRAAAERDEDELPEEFYDIFVVDPKHQPLGTVSLSRVLRTKRPVRVSDLMAAEIRPVPVTMDQEQVAFLFRQYDLVS
ncbi:MAG: magnesium transporter, partial [Proteobacteria bacterium]|nr:magnesium transporter [Pseudomonadota bacterium]